jgi:hypothetical protein
MVTDIPYVQIVRWLEGCFEREKHFSSERGKIIQNGFSIFWYNPMQLLRAGGKSK